MRIGLQLAQGAAQLLGASRQRVNQELKAMEREQAIRIEPGGLVVPERCAVGHCRAAGELDQLALGRGAWVMQVSNL